MKQLFSRNYNPPFLVVALTVVALTGILLGYFLINPGVEYLHKLLQTPERPVREYVFFATWFLPNIALLILLFILWTINKNSSLSLTRRKTLAVLITFFAMAVSISYYIELYNDDPYSVARARKLRIQSPLE